MAYYEGPIVDGPLAGNTMGQWGTTHEVTINGEVVRYQFVGGEWWHREPDWDQEDEEWVKARLGGS